MKIIQGIVIIRSAKVRTTGCCELPPIAKVGVGCMWGRYESHLQRLSQKNPPALRRVPMRAGSATIGDTVRSALALAATAALALTQQQQLSLPVPVIPCIRYSLCQLFPASVIPCNWYSLYQRRTSASTRAAFSVSTAALATARARSSSMIYTSWQIVGKGHQEVGGCIMVVERLLPLIGPAAVLMELEGTCAPAD